MKTTSPFIALCMMTSALVHAQDISFGWLDSPAQRILKIKTALPQGTAVTAPLVINGMTLPLPAGRWQIVAINGDEQVINNLGNDSQHAGVPHANIFMVPLADASATTPTQPKEILHAHVPLRGVANNSWLASPPNLCNPDWNSQNMLQRDIATAAPTSLNCHGIYFSRVFAGNSFLLNNIKLGLRQMAIPYDTKAGYLVSETLLGKNTSIVDVMYGKLLDSKPYRSAQELQAAHAADIEQFELDATHYHAQLQPIAETF